MCQRMCKAGGWGARLDMHISRHSQAIGRPARLWKLEALFAPGMEGVECFVCV